MGQTKPENFIKGNHRPTSLVFTYYFRILHNDVDFRYAPRGTPPATKDIILSLLEKEPEERLGHEGADQVKNHVFFEGTNWEAVSKQLNPPPFVPDLTSDVDVSNFDNLFTDEPVLMSTRHVI